MINFIQKINLLHSVIFFLFFASFSLLLNKFKNIEISPLVCLMLILSIGISHGSLDNIKGKKLLGFYETKNMNKFYFSYLGISILVIVLWLILPAISLILFLIVASYHFGKEDSEFLVIKDSIFNLILYFFKGSLIIIMPLIFHFTDTVNIFKLLLVSNESFYIFLAQIEEFKILYIFFWLSLLSNLFLIINNFKVINVLMLLDFISIVVLNYYLSPLIAFTIYFCFLHSFRHSISLIVELNNEDLKEGFFIFIKKALPLTVLTAVFYVISLYFLSNFYEINDAILKIIFIGLASLTFPHILLEYLLEKNEK